MQDKLTREEVLHVAHLAHIGINEEEIEKYQVSLKQMLNEIDKIKDLNDFDEEFMISPTANKIELENKNCMVDKDNLLMNVPKKKGNFIEVPVVVNE